MKTKGLILFAIMLTAYSCGGQNNKKNKAAAETDTKGTIQITSEDFLKKVADYENSPYEWKYLGDKPAIIDFYADWCGPCQAIAPILEELAIEYKDEIYIYKVDVDQEQELSAAFGISSIPTMLFIPMDGVPHIHEGMMSKETLIEAIDSVMLNKEE